MKLADALLRRKELQNKVDQIKAIKDKDVYEFRFERKQINESIDDIRANVPKLDLNQVTKEFDYYANKLRLIDAAIQQLNWTVDIQVNDLVWKDYAEVNQFLAALKATWHGFALYPKQLEVDQLHCPCQ